MAAASRLASIRFKAQRISRGECKQTLGSVGAGYVAKAKPDGYTLLAVTVAFTITPAFSEQPVDIVRDFAPVVPTSQGTTLLMASPGFGPKNMKDYVAHARAHPGGINFGSTGPSVVIGAWVHSATRTTFTLVPYKGISAMMTDLMASRLDVAAANLGVAIPLLKSGKLRTLGVLNSRRSPALPDLPTLQEQGIEDFDYQNWLGYVAPARTPAAVVSRLNTAFLASIRSPEVVAALEGEGKLPWGATPQEFGQRIAAELTRWRQLARETGYRLE